MDTTLVIMFGAVIVTTTALNFMELRRIRKVLEGKQVSLREKSTAIKAVR